MSVTLILVKIKGTALMALMIIHVSALKDLREKVVKFKQIIVQNILLVKMEPHVYKNLETMNVFANLVMWVEIAPSISMNVIINLAKIKVNVLIKSMIIGNYY